MKPDQILIVTTRHRRMIGTDHSRAWTTHTAKATRPIATIITTTGENLQTLKSKLRNTWPNAEIKRDPIIRLDNKQDRDPDRLQKIKSINS